MFKPKKWGACLLALSMLLSIGSGLKPIYAQDQAATSRQQLLRIARKRLVEVEKADREKKNEERNAFQFKYPDEIVSIFIQLAEPAAVTGGKTEAAVKQDQESVLNQVKNLVGSVPSHQFGFLVNGFTVDAKRSFIPKLAALPGVQNVRELPRLYPTMTSAKKLTKATEVWAKTHQKGEGMVISVIDTGVDPENTKAMRLSDPGKAKLNESKVNSLRSQLHGKDGKYFSEKIPFAYNYADSNLTVTPSVEFHGVHVAGICSANEEGDSGLTGVAPEAQVLGMKVFSEDPERGGAATADVLAAIEDSVKLGADVLNLSLGSAVGFSDAQDIYSQTVLEASKQGVIVVIAAGNDSFSTHAPGSPNKEVDSFDIGLVASPSTIPSALSVASCENSDRFVYEGQFKDANGETTSFRYLHIPTAKTLTFDPQKPYTLRWAGLGAMEDFKEASEGVYEGKGALVQRGTYSFADKVQSALRSQAEFICIFDNDNNEKPTRNHKEPLEGMAGIDEIPFPVFTLDQESGEKLAELMKTKEEWEVIFTEKRLPIPSSESGTMSSFSSWGPAPDLTLKPEVTAPGGQIFSTIVGGYDTYSGTSMATPHVAGAAAILLQGLNPSPWFQAASQVIPKTALVKTIFENTSHPYRQTTVRTNADGAREKLEDVYYSPRLQGAGLIDIEAATRSKVVAYYQEDPSKKSIEDVLQSSLGMIPLRSIQEGEKSFTITLQNFSNQPATFEVDTSAAPQTEIQYTDKRPLQDVVAQGASLKADQPKVTVAGNGTATVTCTLNTGSVKDGFIEGYVQFKSANEEQQPSLSMPYVGFAGDWGAARIFDVPWGAQPTWDRAQTEEEAKTESELSKAMEPKFKEIANSDLAAYELALEQGGTLLRSDIAGSSHILGNLLEAADHRLHHVKHVGISPDASYYFDNIYAQVGLLRAPYELKFDILDDKKNLVDSLDVLHQVPKSLLSRLLDPSYPPLTNAGSAWDGMMHNPNYDASKPITTPAPIDPNDMEHFVDPRQPDPKNTNPARIYAPEGNYYFRVSAKMGPQEQEQAIFMPFKVDVTEPKLETDLKKKESKPANPDSKEPEPDYETPERILRKPSRATERTPELPCYKIAIKIEDKPGKENKAEGVGVDPSRIFLASPDDSVNPASCFLDWEKDESKGEGAYNFYIYPPQNFFGSVFLCMRDYAGNIDVDSMTGLFEIGTKASSHYTHAKTDKMDGDMTIPAGSTIYVSRQDHVEDRVLNVPYVDPYDKEDTEASEDGSKRYFSFTLQEEGADAAELLANTAKDTDPVSFEPGSKTWNPTLNPVRALIQRDQLNQIQIQPYQKKAGTPEESQDRKDFEKKGELQTAFHVIYDDQAPQPELRSDPRIQEYKLSDIDMPEDLKTRLRTRPKSNKKIDDTENFELVDPQDIHVLVAKDDELFTYFAGEIKDNSLPWKFHSPQLFYLLDNPNLNPNAIPFKAKDESKAEEEKHLPWQISLIYDERQEEPLQLHTLYIFDQAQNRASYPFLLLRKSDLHYDAQGKPSLDSKKIEERDKATLRQFELSEPQSIYTGIGDPAQKEIEFSGSCTNIDRVLVNGQEVPLTTPEKDSSENPKPNPEDSAAGDNANATLADNAEQPHPESKIKDPAVQGEQKVFSMKLPLKEGIQYIPVEAFYKNEKGEWVSYAVKRRVICYDIHGPVINLDAETQQHLTVPESSKEEYMEYWVQEGDPVRLSGTFSDNTEACQLRINGELVASHEADVKPIQKEIPFKWEKTGLQDGDSILVETVDQFGVSQPGADEDHDKAVTSQHKKILRIKVRVLPANSLKMPEDQDQVRVTYVSQSPAYMDRWQRALIQFQDSEIQNAVKVEFIIDGKPYVLGTEIPEGTHEVVVKIVHASGQSISKTYQLKVYPDALNLQNSGKGYFKPLIPSNQMTGKGQDSTVQAKSQQSAQAQNGKPQNPAVAKTGEQRTNHYIFLLLAAFGIGAGLLLRWRRKFDQ